MHRPSISFIGSGNVAWHLAQAFSASGFEVMEIFGRSKKGTQALAALCKAIPKSLSDGIDTKADVLLLCVPDQVISNLVPQLSHLKSVLIHTAGTLDLEEIRHPSGYGVFYPLQTFTRGFEIHLEQVPILIEASDKRVMGMLEHLGNSLSCKVEVCSSERRKRIHLAAVWASNYSNHMMEIASGILREQDIPFHFIHELLGETLRKAMILGTEKAQTGPALRRDEKVIQAHLELLRDDKLKALYALIAASVQDRHPLD